MVLSSGLIVVLNCGLKVGDPKVNSDPLLKSRGFACERESNLGHEFKKMNIFDNVKPFCQNSLINCS